MHTATRISLVWAYTKKSSRTAKISEIYWAVEKIFFVYAHIGLPIALKTQETHENWAVEKNFSVFPVYRLPDSSALPVLFFRQT